MRIAFEHLHGLMAGNRRDLHVAQVGVFEKPAGCLMAEIVKVQIGDTYVFACFGKCVGYRPPLGWEKSCQQCSLRSSKAPRLPSSTRNRSRFAVLGICQQDRALQFRLTNSACGVAVAKARWHVPAIRWCLPDALAW
jgi:hypothetical protein